MSDGMVQVKAEQKYCLSSICRMVKHKILAVRNIDLWDPAILVRRLLTVLSEQAVV